MHKVQTATLIMAAMATSAALGQSFIEDFNSKGYGTLSGRLQSVNMYRDYDDGNNAFASSLGIILKYQSPDYQGFSFGAAYNGAGIIDSMDYGTSTSPGEYLLQNGRISLLNEAYISYNMEALGLSDTSITAGRRINNAEVFRADDIRQKSRSIMAIQAESKDVENWRFAGGHSFEQSGILDMGDRWEFRDYGDVLGTGYDIDGITWGEATFSGIENVEISAFDAAAWDAANMIGTRATINLTEKTSILAYYRNETDMGDAANHDSDLVGLSIVQKVGSVRVEGGYFGVYGDNLTFNQLTTGINHALGASLMIYTGQYNGDADTFYVKATTKLKATNTILYTLANYTRQNADTAAFDNAAEFDFIAKQPINDQLMAVVKAGVAYRDEGSFLNPTATDVRFFLTYKF